MAIRMLVRRMLVMVLGMVRLVVAVLLLTIMIPPMNEMQPLAQCSGRRAGETVLRRWVLHGFPLGFDW